MKRSTVVASLWVLGALALPPAGALGAASPVPAQEAAGQAARDAEIERDLNAVFARIGGLSDVTAEVEAGVVVLRGRTLSLELRAEADRLAHSLSGVVFVDNQIAEETDLGVRLSQATQELRDRALRGVAYLPLLTAALLIVLAFVLLAGLAGRWDAPYRVVTDNPFARSLVRQIVQGAIVLVGLVSALELLDATALVGAVLGAAGVLGIAAGFAFRNIIENHLAGAILSLRRPFHLDDHIVIGSYEGKVLRLTPRETILMTPEGNHLRIPNATVFSSVILNYTTNPRRRFHFEVSVGTGEDLARAQDVGRGALLAMSGVLDDPAPHARVMELGDSWVTVRYIGWVDQRSNAFHKVRGEAVRVVKEALDAAGVDMPSPEYMIRMREQGTGAGAGSGGAGAGGPAHDVDVAPDEALDRQIAEDRARSGQENLLDPRST